MDGASLYQSLALFFVVQAAGLHLSIGQQVLMILTLLISSKGTAGVARALAADCFRRGDFVSSAHGTVISSLRDRSTHGHGRTAWTVLGNCVACVVLLAGKVNSPPNRHFQLGQALGV